MMAPTSLNNPHCLLGIAFDGESLEELAEAIAQVPQAGQGVRLVVTANTDHVVLLNENAALRQAYRRSWRHTIDGMPLWLYGRIRSKAVPPRVTGADLFPVVLRRLIPTIHRLFFVAATDEIARRLKDWGGKAGYSADALAVEIPPFGFERDMDYGEQLAGRIRMFGATHLFFGVGCPRSEIWIDEHSGDLGDLYALAVGAALSFFTGTSRRAPALISKIGFEWMWRMIQEPRRLGPRYLGRGWKFIAIIVSDLRGRCNLI